jgi:hypothetical protein
MSTQVQFRRGNTAQTATFTGVTAEITVDTTKNTVVVHDGSTAGGFALARESAVTANSFSVIAAFNTANAAFASANISNGIDATQNNSITVALNTANAAFAQANTAATIPDEAPQAALPECTAANIAEDALPALTAATIAD